MGGEGGLLVAKALRALPRNVKHALATQGWTVGLTRSCHVRLTSPTGQVVIMSSSPSDRRSLRNTLSDLRRAGLEMGEP